MKTRHLIPLFSCLSEPDGPLIKIFSGRNVKGTVYSLATTVSANGTIVISAFTENPVKIKELETGMLLYGKSKGNQWRTHLESFISQNHSRYHFTLYLNTSNLYVLVKRRAGDLYPILKLERKARVLNRIKVELRVF